MMKISDETLSKTLAYMLRHHPDEFGLDIGSQGWCALHVVESALAHRWPDVSREDIERVVNCSGRKRFEIAKLLWMEGDFIRAMYGHSIPIFHSASRAPPDILYHGTSERAAEIILSSGLAPVGRTFVHLSTSLELADDIGQRKGKDVVVLLVDAMEASRNQVRFFRATDDIWLASFIPSEYIRKGGDSGKSKARSR